MKNLSVGLPPNLSVGLPPLWRVLFKNRYVQVWIIAKS